MSTSLHLLVCGSLVLTALSAVPVITYHTHSGEVERPAEDRPRSGKPDEPNHERYESFFYTWLEIENLPNPDVAQKINKRLRELAAPATLPPAGPIVHRLEEPTDTSMTIAHAQTTADTLLVVLESHHRGADAPQYSVSTSVHAFDLNTGRELTFNDFFPRKFWPMLKKEFRRAFDTFKESNPIYSESEFPSIDARTSGYFVGGNFRLLVRPLRGSSAGEDHPFLDIPASKLVRLISPRARALLDAPINADWTVEDRDNEFTARSPQFPKINVPLFCDGWTVWLIDWEIPKENPQLGLLRYFSGFAGTSAIYGMTRVAVIRLSDGQVLGHPLERIDALFDAEEYPQPQWHWKDGVLTVKADGETTTYKP